MRRVLHVITGLGVGGAERALTRLIAVDDRNAHHVVSLTGDGPIGDDMRGAGAGVDWLDMPRGRLTFQGVRKLFRVLRSFDPDVVQTWMYHSDVIGGVVARLAGKNTVVWGVRATDAHLHDRALAGVTWLAARLSRLVPSRIVIASRTAAELHRELGYDASRIVVIANGYDVGSLTPDEPARIRMRAQWRVPADVTLIGTLARWDPLKDHQNLIAALGLLRAAAAPSWRCVLIGENMTPSNAPLAALLRQHGVEESVILAGPTKDVGSALNALDVHVLPSKSEGFPNAVAEAMACGIPCIVTAAGDAPLIVGDTGWVVEPGNPHALAGTLRSAMNDLSDAAAWRARKDAARRRIVEQFSIQRAAAAYNAVWDEVLRERDGGAAAERR